MPDFFFSSPSQGIPKHSTLPAREMKQAAKSASPTKRETPLSAHERYASHPTSAENFVLCSLPSLCSLRHDRRPQRQASYRKSVSRREERLRFISPRQCEVLLEQALDCTCGTPSLLLRVPRTSVFDLIIITSISSSLIGCFDRYLKVCIP